MEEQQLLQKKRVRDESSVSDSVDSAAAKKIRDDLLVLLDEPDSAPTVDVDGSSACESNIHELDSFMKSFEEELVGCPTSTNTISPPAVVDGSESGGSHPELGFLLGASDDELGLPCSTTEQDLSSDNADLVRVMSESSSGIGELWEFDDGGLGSYVDNSFGFVGGVEEPGNDFVTLDGIFDYSDVNFGPLDYANDNNNNSWQQESLPAL